MAIFIFEMFHSLVVSVCRSISNCLLLNCVGVFDLAMMISTDETSTDDFIATTSSSDTGELKSTLWSVIAEFLELSKSIFEVFYRLKPDNLIVHGALSSGPITDSSTIDDLTDLVRIILN